MQNKILGIDFSHLVKDSDSDFFLDANALSDLKKLQACALENNFNLAIYSSFRSFEAQCSIWNKKVRGERALLDSQGNPLFYDELSPKEILYAIMRWSAIPGFSRHHWGSDLDIFDAHAMSRSLVQLTPSEVEGDGACAPMHNFLGDILSTYGFYLPYDQDRGGVAPERWHISHIKTSRIYFEQLSLEFFIQTIEQYKENILLSELILEEAEDIYEQFVVNVAPYK